MIGHVFALAVLLAGVSGRYLLIEERPLHFAEDGVLPEGAEYFNGPLETLQFDPVYSRVRRQAQTTLSVDGKTGTPEFSAKIPVVKTDSNAFSIIGSQSPVSRSLGLALDNAQGHGLSLSTKTIPEFGKQLTAAGKLNLLNTEKHNIDANAFLTRNMPNLPNAPNLPNFNTYGGALDYTFNKKIGASIGAAQTDFLKRTDVSALGHLNLFRNKDTSFDINAGATKSFSPFIPKSSWEPTYGFSLTKFW